MCGEADKKYREQDNFFLGVVCVKLLGMFFKYDGKE